MGGKKRLVVLGALVALVAALIPTGLAIGSHEGDQQAAEDSSVVLLTLGYHDEVSWEGNIQNISSKHNKCLSVSFGTDPELLDVTPIGGALGLYKDGLGVKSRRDGYGSPCGRVEAYRGEALSVALGDALDGYLMSAIDVDLELKHNAVVDVRFKHEGVSVAETRFDPMGGSDDGPDSKDGDNYRFYFRPMDGYDPILFDEVVFVAKKGAFSLEGGADLRHNHQPSAFGRLDPTSKSSQFEVVPRFDGQINCGELVFIEEAEFPDVFGELTLHSMELDDESDPGWSVGNCRPKFYNDDIGEDNLLFLPSSDDSRARFTIRIRLRNQPIESDSSGQVTTLVMLYNAAGDLTALQPVRACQGQPVLDGGGYDDFWSQEDVGMLPAGETACYFGAVSTPTGVDESGTTLGTEVWDIYFEDDPAFSFG